MVIHQYSKKIYLVLYKKNWSDSNIYQNTQLTTLLLTSTRIRFCTLRKWLRRWQILRWFEQISEPGFKCFSRMMMASSFPIVTIISVSVVIRSKWISSGWWRWWITSRGQWLVRTTWQYLTWLKRYKKNSWTQKSLDGKKFFCEYFQKIQWNWVLPDDIELWELLDNNIA